MVMQKYILLLILIFITRVHTPHPSCGNGMLEPGETCEHIAGFNPCCSIVDCMPLRETESCGPSSVCIMGICTPLNLTLCGDGIINLDEKCDLGTTLNNLAGTCCNPDCTLANFGRTCETTPSSGMFDGICTIPTHVCSNSNKTCFHDFDCPPIIISSGDCFLRSGCNLPQCDPETLCGYNGDPCTLEEDCAIHSSSSARISDCAIHGVCDNNVTVPRCIKNENIPFLMNITANPVCKPNTCGTDKDCTPISFLHFDPCVQNMTCQEGNCISVPIMPCFDNHVNTSDICTKSKFDARCINPEGDLGVPPTSMCMLDEDCDVEGRCNTVENVFPREGKPCVFDEDCESGGLHDTTPCDFEEPSPGCCEEQHELTCDNPFFREPFCGDGMLEGEEECDLGVFNGVSGFCCNENCTLLQLGSPCEEEGAAGFCFLPDRACSSDHTIPCCTGEECPGFLVKGNCLVAHECGYFGDVCTLGNQNSVCLPIADGCDSVSMPSGICDDTFMTSSGNCFDRRECVRGMSTSCECPGHFGKECSFDVECPDIPLGICNQATPNGLCNETTTPAQCLDAIPGHPIQPICVVRNCTTDKDCFFLNFERFDLCFHTLPFCDEGTCQFRNSETTPCNEEECLAIEFPEFDNSCARCGSEFTVRDRLDPSFDKTNVENSREYTAVADGYGNLAVVGVGAFDHSAINANNGAIHLFELIDPPESDWVERDAVLNTHSASLTNLFGNAVAIWDRCVVALTAQDFLETGSSNTIMTSFLIEDDKTLTLIQRVTNFVVGPNAINMNGDVDIYERWMVSGSPKSAGGGVIFWKKGPGRLNCTWDIKQAIPTDEISELSFEDEFGRQVDMDGNYSIISAERNALIYKKVGETWSVICNPSLGGVDNFGEDVAIHFPYFAISRGNRIHVYNFTDTTCTLEQIIEPLNARSGRLRMDLRTYCECSAVIVLANEKTRSQTDNDVEMWTRQINGTWIRQTTLVIPDFGSGISSIKSIGLGGVVLEELPDGQVLEATGHNSRLPSSGGDGGFVNVISLTYCQQPADQCGICGGDGCSCAVCGDGIFNPECNEGCDEGVQNGEPTSCCQITCRLKEGICRPSTGDCDPAEECMGTGECPPDIIDPDDTLCDESRGICLNGTCIRNATECGNGIVEEGEECDLGAFNGNPGLCCNETCKFDRTGRECRASAGICDVAEECSGESATCPPDDKRMEGLGCREGTAFSCEQDSFCDGISNDCPPNLPLEAGIVCRPKNGFCDVLERCNGVNTTCPEDKFRNSSLICRPAINQCDLTEVCSGNSADCPEDIFKPVSTPCSLDNLTCTLELCDGRECVIVLNNCDCETDQDCIDQLGDLTICLTTECIETDCDNTPIEDTCFIDGRCFNDTDLNPNNPCQICDVESSITSWSFSPQGTFCDTGSNEGPCSAQDVCDGSGTCEDQFLAENTCRASAGVCDAEEVCEGDSDDCPPDLFIVGGVCRTAAGPCDAEELCSGVSIDCPSDMFLTTNALCRPVVGLCDLPEFCPGNSIMCSPDIFEQAGTLCRDAMGICDRQERCNGTSPHCPLDVFLDSSIECREAAGDCDLVENCSGFSAICPEDLKKPAETLCRAARGECDEEERCTGLTSGCPIDLLKTPADICRPATHPCDSIERCTGISIDCPIDRNLTEGAGCNGLNLTCVSGRCNDQAVCIETQSTGTCLINNTCFDFNDANPMDPCLFCDTSVNTTDWTARPPTFPGCAPPPPPPPTPPPPPPPPTPSPPPPPPTPPPPPVEDDDMLTALAALIGVIGLILVSCICCFLLWKRRHRKIKKKDDRVFRYFPGATEIIGTKKRKYVMPRTIRYY